MLSPPPQGRSAARREREQSAAPDATPVPVENGAGFRLRDTIARVGYTFAWFSVLPCLPLRLWWRGRAEPEYRESIGERFGLYRTRAGAPRRPVIWIHAVSVGETRAAAPLVNLARREVPHATILLTHMTAAGRAAGRALFGDRVLQAWLPYDLPFAIGRFLAHFRPTVGLLLETEVWPNLLAIARRRGVPVYLVNARLSARSAAGYRRLGSLGRRAFAALAGVAAQSTEDAARLASCGAPPPVVVANIKFDFPVAEDQRSLGESLRARFGRDRPVWVAASTREGEEAMLLDALASASLPDGSLMVLVPRHPQRFDAVGRMLDERGVAFVRRSSTDPVHARTRVVLGDSMGEMLAYYASADLAVIGGGFLPLGGQNLIEAMAMERPVIVGPHMFNFADATAAALAAGAAEQVTGAAAALARVGTLLADPDARRRMAVAGLALAREHRGATARTWRWLVADLAKRGVELGSANPAGHQAGNVVGPAGSSRGTG